VEKMKKVCPNCEKIREIDLLKNQSQVVVRGETIVVDDECFKCQTCGETFENTRGRDDLEIAYREYRKRHQMLQPEEIRDWRRSLGLTQKELSILLGWGGATLSRYENGALQMEAHDRLLKLIMDPNNLIHIINEMPNSLSNDKRNRLLAELRAGIKNKHSFMSIYEDRFGHYDADEFSGYAPLDLTKLFNMILYFCKGGQLKTKLNKLLFYADFKHFKENTLSITGAHYVHFPHGPIPDNYEHYFAKLIHEGDLSVEEEFIYQYPAENFIAKREPDLSIFSNTELKVITEVKAYFEDFNASKIRNFSHDEKGYSETQDKELISYNYAEFLQL